MATSQSSVARLETTATDAKISTVERYADSLGYVVQYHLIPVEKTVAGTSLLVAALGALRREPSAPCNRGALEAPAVFEFGSAAEPARQLGVL